jgi:hypothetical protein
MKWFKSLRYVLKIRTWWFKLKLKHVEAKLTASKNPFTYPALVQLMVVTSTLESEGLDAAIEQAYHPEIRAAKALALKEELRAKELRGMQVHITEPLDLGNGIIQEPLTPEDLEMLRVKTRMRPASDKQFEAEDYLDPDLSPNEGIHFLILPPRHRDET